MDIAVKYFDKGITKLDHIGGSIRSTWIDVRASRIQSFDKEDLAWYISDTGEKYFQYKAGDEFLIKLGFGMILPEGYEGITAPRGSTFKTYGFIQVNSTGVVDEGYNGDNDEWFIPVYALKDGQIFYDDRFAQFRIQEKMQNVYFTEVDKLKAEDRGGFGESGTK